MAMDFQIIQTSRKSFDSWRDPPIRKTLAKSDTTDTTNAGPEIILKILFKNLYVRSIMVFLSAG